MKSSSYRSLAVVVLFACMTVVSIDLVLAHIVPVLHRREVQEGVRDLERSDPETLVIGSSHARTFHVLGAELAARTNAQRTLVAVPLEFGKLRSYAWMLDHRIAPLVDDEGPKGQLKRANLKRLLILTEWWDSCPGPDWNLPSRVWTFSNFLGSLANTGLTSYNRNYLQSRWKRLFWDSALAQDRGTKELFNTARDRLLHRTTVTPEAIQHTTEVWQHSIEAGTECIGDTEQMAGLRHLLDFGRTHQLETTVILFPRKPGTMTEKAKATTLTAFRNLVAELIAPYHARLVDLTWSTPLTDQDFMADFDHVSIEGNVKFARWALDGPLSFLTQAPQAEFSQVSP